MSTRTFVVGDIHGCLDEVDALLDGLSATAGDRIVFLGDYVDRGPASKAVIDRLIRLQREGPQCVFLRGNHEDMFLAYMGMDGHYGDAFLVNGGRATLRSYDLETCDGAAVAQRIPSAHIEFLRALRDYEIAGDFLCVHAGINPLRPLEKQSSEDLLWIREEFIRNRHPLPYIVLFGHTPHRDVPTNLLPYKIGLDTGLVYSNKLSCLELESGELLQVRRGERSVRRSSLAELLRPAQRRIQSMRRSE
ncbi:MAG TPA: metallophosphoesterase family protein [Candidatus Binatia bacterium]|nr:metallophosphoesterase family protein [Candidatus Binatia bacterium]